MDKDQIENLEYLLFRYFDNSINEDEITELNSILLDNDAAQERYFDILKVVLVLNKSSELTLSQGTGTLPIKSALEELALDEDTAPELVIEVPDAIQADRGQDNGGQMQTSRFFRIYHRIISVAAVLMFLFILYANLFPPKLFVPVAMVKAQLNVKWENEIEKINAGSILYTGDMALKRGLVEIKLNNGAEVIIEGPCQFNLESDCQLFLHSGSIVANIEEADNKRFVVRTQNATVVDYGTEFGVVVDRSGNTATQVFKGCVELRKGPDPLKYEQTLRLEKDQGGLISPDGLVSNISSNSYAFVRKDQFRSEIMAAEGSAYHKWKAYSYDLRNRQDLVAYYTFEKDDSGMLTNSASATQGLYQGKLSSYISDDKSPKWVEGRWPQKTALKFNSKEKQYVLIDSDSKLNINGAVTLAAWVKLESLKGGGHILSNRIKFGPINYQLGFNVPNSDYEYLRMQFARYLINVEKSGVTRKYSPQIPEDNFLGWHLLVTCHDNQNVYFYFDGKIIEIQEYKFITSPAVADLVIGSDRSDEKFGGNFEGVIGEVAIFNTMLGVDEIKHMYQVGCPK